jgi:hypothetical protein
MKNEKLKSGFNDFLISHFKFFISQFNNQKL